MEKAVDGTVELLIAQYGLPGIAILVLGFVAWRFFKLYCSAQEKLNALQETRVAEVKEGVRALEANTDAMNRLTEFVRDRLRPVA